MDGITFSSKPVAFTHTMCESIYRDHPRAKTDKQIKAIAAKGGMIGITMIGYFVGPDPGGETTIENYVDHIDRAVNIAGIEHVGMSSDFAIRGIVRGPPKRPGTSPVWRYSNPATRCAGHRGYPSWMRPLASGM